MNAKQRYQNRSTAAWLHRSNPTTVACPNCGELTHHGHFVPPCFGEAGFFLCDSRVDPGEPRGGR